MRSFKKILLILLGILLLSGCTFKNTNEMSIDKEGKFDYSFSVMLDKNTLTTIIQSENENEKITNDVMLQYLEDGINYTFLEGLEKSTISDDEFIGYKYNYKVNHIDEISDEKTEHVNLNFYSSKEKLTDLKLFKKIKNKYQANFNFNLNNTNATKSDDIITNSDDIVTNSDDITTPSDDNKIDLNKINFITEFSVTLPYKALTHNADNMTNEGKTLNWTINTNKNETIKFTFSLLHIELIKQIATIVGSVVLLLILMLVIARKKKKKTKKIIYLIFGITTLLSIAVILYLYNRPNIKIPSIPVIEEKTDEYFLFENNTITLKFEDLDNSANELNSMLNYTESTDKIYLNIVDKMMKNDENIKMYDEGNKKILETTLNQEQAANIFGNYVNNIEGNTTIKVIFNTETNDKNIDEIDFKINREKIIREKIVATALKEVGNTGEKYWTWYLGRNTTFMEYCAAFVTWVGDQNDQIKNGNIPTFAWVKVGVDYYKGKGQFKYNKDYTPKPGDIVFFNWNNANDLIDHVGIVEKYEDGYVYTIEGNVGGTSDMSTSQKAKVRKVVQRKYKKSSLHLYGYGIPKY